MHASGGSYNMWFMSDDFCGCDSGTLIGRGTWIVKSRVSSAVFSDESFILMKNSVIFFLRAAVSHSGDESLTVVLKKSF
jgi:hypothetical protein